MDPVSIAEGAVSLLHVCEKFVRYLVQIKNAARTIDADLQRLLDDANVVKASTTLLKELHDERSKQKQASQAFVRKKLSESWNNVSQILVGCGGTIERLQDVLRKAEDVEVLPHFKTPSRLESIVKAIKKHASEDDFNALRRELRNYGSTLQMLFFAIQILSTWENQTSQDSLADEIRQQFERLNQRIETFQPALGPETGANVRSALDTAKAVASLASENQHFDIPQPVRSIFTGRQEQLLELKETILAPDSTSHNYSIQKRFVIYGLGGSGKTQFCCKFAQDNRQRFWGIFWIDASSEERAKQTFSEIAKSAGLEPNENAAKRWLASLDKPWLLIVDGVESNQVELDPYFPPGERGHILVTTTNPLHMTQGTVGRKFFDFSNNLESTAANSLLLKAANEPEPWNHTAQELATGITTRLGYLPLALIVAGSTILSGFCKLRDYLTFYEDNWRRLRHRSSNKGMRERSLSDADPHLKIHATCELMYRSLIILKSNANNQAASDAVELLNVFSFLYREDITMDLLLQGAKNPQIEREEAKRQNDQENRSPRATWLESAKALSVKFLASVLADRSKSVLPDCMRPVDGVQGYFDDYRMRAALAELCRRSLIMFNPVKDSYSMHPIVHKWVRERAEMSTADQAVWCQAAANLLSQAILLPPLATQNADDNFRRGLLSHVVFMRKCKQEINQHYTRNRAQGSSLRQLFWPMMKPSITRNEALSLAKYSIVYAQCGQWKEAESLQIAVKDFVQAMLGDQHPSTIRIKRALAGTYWQLGRGDEAADLQASALEAASKSLGPNNHTTLMITDSLAVSRWMQGRYRDALHLHKVALAGLSTSVGPDHEDTLRVQDHLGRVHFKYWRFDTARRLHETAMRGLTQCLGAKHLDTLEAKDNLAMTYLALGSSADLALAEDLINEVLSARKAMLGKEHPYTLWASLNLARIKAARGRLDEAESDVRKGLLIAYRNLGTEHIGVLYARMYLGEILVKAGRLQEAESELESVMERQRALQASQTGVHPDRLMAMYILADCLRVQGRFDEGVLLCEKAIEELSSVPAGKEHPFIGKLEERIRELIEERG